MMSRARPNTEGPFREPFPRILATGASSALPPLFSRSPTRAALLPGEARAGAREYMSRQPCPPTVPANHAERFMRRTSARGQA